MRSYRSVKKVAFSSMVIVIATVALTSGVVADPAVNHCTIGEVTSAFEAFIPGFKLHRELGLGYGGLAEGVDLCQYRLFADWLGFDEVCFCEEDLFLGGINWYVEMGEPDGMSPSEAKEWLNQLKVEVFFTPEGGEPSPLDVVETAVKEAVHPTFGRVAYQQHGVFFQLPPGDYLSTLRDCHPDFGSCDPGGDGWFESNVTVRVLPHDVAHDLGAPTDSPFGSVQCPED